MKRAPDSVLPMVNLASRQPQERRAGRWRPPLRGVVLAAVAALAWAVTGAGVAILAGWRLDLPFGP